VLHAQPTIEWQRCLGGSDLEYKGLWISPTLGGGFIGSGQTSSNNGDVSGNQGQKDIWVVKLDSSGIIEWQKCFGGTAEDEAYPIEQTVDGGYIFSGATKSVDGDVVGNHGSQDAWIVKLNSTGEIQWQKCIGGTGFDNSHKIKQTLDGGYVFVGQTFSNDGDVSGNHGEGDAWVVKLNSIGEIQWQKCFGGSALDAGLSIQQTTNGGYIFSGETFSNNGDVSGNNGADDAWIVELNPTGEIQWQKCLGGTGNEAGFSILQTSEGDFIFSGVTDSNNGDVSGNHGQNDAWIIRFDSAGTIQWKKCFGGTNDDYGISINPTNDGNFILIGSTSSNDGDVSGNHGISDFWIVKFDSSGVLQWQKCLGGQLVDGGLSIHPISNNGFVCSGFTQSDDGDVSGNNGLIDFWAVKLRETTSISPVKINPSSLFLLPNPTNGSIHLNSESAFVGKPYQIFNAQGKEVLSGQINAEEMPLSTEGLPAGIYTILAAGQAARMVKE
jgi:hypothetical protein